MNRDRLYRLYSGIESVITPGLRYSQYFYEDAVRESLHANDWWLDLGCGHRALPDWREKQEQALVRTAGCVVGLDYDWSSLLKHRSIKNRVRGDISHLCFRENTFDLVSANMVVEHLKEPTVQFREIYRVLKPGGLFLFHTPNASGYTTVAARIVPEFLKGGLLKVLDGRTAEDVFKTHYKANTEENIRQLASASSLETVRIRYVASSAKFAVVAPLAFLELFWIKLLLTDSFRSLRTNLIVTLRKPTTESLTI